MIGNFPAVLNFNRLFIKLNQFICNQQDNKTDKPHSVAFRKFGLATLDVQ